jgi:hypothetical protein
MEARLYEFRLFVDEPKLIWRAQLGLARDGLKYLSLMLVPLAVLTLPMLLLFAQLQAFYGYSPLRPGEPANLTVQLRQPLGAGDEKPVLEVPAGFVVETPPVRVLHRAQVSWRVRPIHEASGTLRVTLQTDSAAKSISAGSGPRYLSRRRVSSFADLLWFAAEPAIAPGRIDWIEIDYAEADIRFLDVRLHWLVWLLIVSMTVSLLLRRRLGVSF